MTLLRACTSVTRTTSAKAHGPAMPPISTAASQVKEREHQRRTLPTLLMPLITRRRPYRVTGTKTIAESRVRCAARAFDNRSQATLTLPLTPRRPRASAPKAEKRSRSMDRTGAPGLHRRRQRLRNQRQFALRNDLMMGARLAHLQQRFQTHQIFIHRMLWISAEELCQQMPRSAHRRLVGKLHRQPGSTIPIRLEANATPILNRRARQTPPRQELLRLHFCNLCVPLHRDASRPARNPMRTPRLCFANLFEMRHETREVLIMAPEIIDLVDGSRNIQGLMNMDPVPLLDTDQFL